MPSRPGLRADVVDGVADARRRALDDFVGARDPETEHVDERIARIALVEGDLAAHGRNPDAVAVAGDAGDDAGHRPAHQRFVERSESQRVEERDRTRTHREDVADDAADAGRRALIRLDERRVIVRLDLEDRGETVADIDCAGILSRPLQHARAGGRQRFQMHARALVAAVLRPHHRKDAELGERRLAAHDVEDPLVFLTGEPVSVRERRR